MELPAGTAVAAALGAAGTAAFAALWGDQARFVDSCLPETVGACLGFRLPILLVLPIVVTAAGWLALRAADAPRAPAAALLGALATTGGLLLYEAFHPRWVPPPVWLAALLGAAGFAAGAAVAVAPLGAAVRAALVLPLLVPFAAFPVLHRSAERADKQERLTRLALPLLVPSGGGWEVTGAVVGRGGGVLTVAVENGSRLVWLTTIRVPVDFAPPARCGPAVADVAVERPDRASAPCRQVAPDHWVRAEAGQEIHLVRRGAALVLVSPDAISASGADVEQVAGRLVEVTPRRLAELSVG